MTGNNPYDEENRTSKNIEPIEARQKIARFCAYQERAHAEVEEKLYSYGLKKDEVEELLAWLISENFVNEERYAIAFAGGKFRVKRWGRLKIKQHLKHKKVSDYSINKALAEIEEGAYLASIDHLIETIARNVKADNIYELRHKISRSMMAKGYEPELVWERIKLQFENNDNF